MESSSDSKELWDLARKESTIGMQEEEKEFDFGTYYAAAFQADIKHLTISFARYKFITKLFRFEKEYKVLELGCTEGIGSHFFMQPGNCNLYTGVDFDSEAIKWAKQNLLKENTQFIEADFLNQKYGEFDVVASLDVIEHISGKKENDYINTICNNLSEQGTAVIGTPSITMVPYASKASKAAHVNMFSQERLYSLCKNKFHNVFIFNMNDELIHLGMDQMSCYIFAVCTGKKCERSQ